MDVITYLCWDLSQSMLVKEATGGCVTSLVEKYDSELRISIYSFTLFIIYQQMIQ